MKKKPVTRFTIAERHVEDLVRTFVRDGRTEPVTWAELVALKEKSKTLRSFRTDSPMVLDERDFAEQLERLRVGLARDEDERKQRDAAWKDFFEDEERGAA